MKNIVIWEAEEPDGKFAELISAEMESSAKIRGTGISKRSPASIIQKIKEGKAVIAVDGDEWVGFSYIEIWAGGEFVSNSGLIIRPEYRHLHVATLIKEKIFALSQEQFPGAKIFTITTGLAIMKMNAALGFETVTFNEVAHDEAFWKGCSSCVNYNILKDKNYQNCLCTDMLFEPKKYRAIIESEDKELNVI